ncbi:hypothetical protein AN641_07565 [Candidatus Epulonipiscioides gigas]|nr:hypothetical protein AN641_07565 [Epulopiscium sp. SCG-C07WGA-EpuloA2]
MPKYFVDSSNIKEDTILITDDNFHHIKNVMRFNLQDELTIGNKENINYKCVIEEIGKDFIKAKILETFMANTEPSIEVVLFAPLIKGDKMELVIQKAIEIGATKIIPIYTKNCVVKLEAEKKTTSKLERWNKIAESASKQSGRGVIVSVEMPMDFKNALSFAKENFEINIIPYEKEQSINIKTALRDNTFSGIGIFIGPEGGFDKDEIALSEQFNVVSVSLGQRILRSETASIVSIALVIYELEL